MISKPIFIMFLILITSLFIAPLISSIIESVDKLISFRRFTFEIKSRYLSVFKDILEGLKGKSEFLLFSLFWFEFVIIVFILLQLYPVDFLLISFKNPLSFLFLSLMLIIVSSSGLLKSLYLYHSIGANFINRNMETFFLSTCLIILNYLAHVFIYKSSDLEYIYLRQAGEFFSFFPKLGFLVNPIGAFFFVGLLFLQVKSYFQESNINSLFRPYLTNFFKIVSSLKILLFVITFDYLFLGGMSFLTFLNVGLFLNILFFLTKILILLIVVVFLSQIIVFSISKSLIDYFINMFLGFGLFGILAYILIKDYFA